MIKSINNKNNITDQEFIDHTYTLILETIKCIRQEEERRLLFPDQIDDFDKELDWTISEMNKKMIELKEYYHKYTGISYHLSPLFFRKYQRIKKEQEILMQSLETDLLQSLGDKITKDDEVIWMKIIQKNIMEYVKYGVSYANFISEVIVTIPLEVETIKNQSNI